MKKFKKILGAATAAAMFATSVVTAPANAALTEPKHQAEGMSFNMEGNDLIVNICCDGNRDPNLPAGYVFDRGIDLSKFRAVTFTFRASDANWGSDLARIGGTMVTREWQIAGEAWDQIANGEADPDEVEVDEDALALYEKYNWQISELSGASDPRVEALGNNIYRAKATIANPVAAGDCTAEDVVFAGALFHAPRDIDVEITGIAFYDANDDVILELDGEGFDVVRLEPSDSTNIHFDTQFEEGDGDGANIIADLLITQRTPWLGDPMTLDVDFSKLGGVAATFHIAEGGRDKFYGTVGGSVGASIGVNPPADGYGWMGTMFGGILDTRAPYPTPGIAPNGVTEDPNLSSYLDFMDPDWGTFAEPLGDYTYRVKSTFNNPVADGVCTVDQLTDVRVFLQLWDSTGIWHEDTEVWEVMPLLPNYIDYVEFERFVLFDIDNNPIMAIDGSGKVVATTAADAKEPVMPQKPFIPDPPSFAPSNPNTSTPDTSGSDTSEPTTSEPATSKPDEDTTVFEPAIDADELAELDEETKEIVQHVVVEDAGDAFEEGTVMNIGDVEKTEESFGFDITFTKDGKEVQPKSVVTVKIPVPEYLQNVTVYLYHYDENGKPTAIKFEIKDGVMIFEATSFSKYEISTVRIAEAFADDTSAPATSDSNTTANPSTGIGYAFIPVMLAAGAAVVLASKKRK